MDVTLFARRKTRAALAAPILRAWRLNRARSNCGV